MQHVPMEKVYKSDSNGIFSIWHFNDGCELDEKAGPIRGWVIDNATGVCVAKSLPFTPEICADNIEFVAGFLGTRDLTTVPMYEALEGTILRLFNWNETWYMATHRKLGGENTWGGLPFKKLFFEMQKFPVEALDTTLTYSFLVSHPKLLQVYPSTRAQLTLISIWNRTTDIFLEQSEFPQLAGVETPKAIVGLTTLEHLYECVQTMKTFDSCGIIAYPCGPSIPIKIVSKEYLQAKELRGNTPSISLRYLDLRSEPEKQAKLVAFYGQDVFDGLEHRYTRLVKRVFSLYLDFYVNKHVTVLPKEQFVAIRRCHNAYLASKERMSLGQVRQVLDETETRYIVNLFAQFNLGSV